MPIRRGESPAHANGENASGAPARSTPGPGPASPGVQSTVQPVRVATILGGMGFLYGAVTGTQRYGLTPWALLSAYAAAVLLAVKVAVEFAPLWPYRIPRGRSRAARIAATLARYLDRGGPAMLLAPALTIPCAVFAGYGLIHLARAV